MSVGLFCIASDCMTGPNEIITHNVNGFLYPVGDFVSLAKYMLYAALNTEETLSMSRNAITTINLHFDIQRMVRDYNDLISH